MYRKERADSKLMRSASTKKTRNTTTDRRAKEIKDANINIAVQASVSEADILTSMGRLEEARATMNALLTSLPCANTNPSYWM